MSSLLHNRRTYAIRELPLGFGIRILTTLEQINPVPVEHGSAAERHSIQKNGVLVGGALALFFSANAVLVLFYGAIGVAGNSIVTGTYLAATEIAVLLLSFRRTGRTWCMPSAAI